MVHIYVSTALFSLLIFFCVTGLLLNHLPWISNDGKLTGVKEGSLPKIVTRVFNKDKLPTSALLVIQPYLSQRYKLDELASFDWDKDANELILDYPVPAGYALVIIDTHLLNYSIEYQQANMLSILNDLHKGRHSGAVWSWIIDITAVLVCIFSFTGLIILFQNKKKRRFGLWLTLLGSITPVIIYCLFVPRLSGLL